MSNLGNEHPNLIGDGLAIGGFVADFLGGVLAGGSGVAGDTGWLRFLDPECLSGHFGGYINGNAHLV